MDVLTVAGTPENVVAGLQTIDEDQKEHRLELKTGKSKLLIFSGMALQQQVTGKKVHPNSTKYHHIKKKPVESFGSLITLEATTFNLGGKVASICLFTSHIQIFQAYQTLDLMYNCLAIPKLSYLFRTAPLFRYSIKSFDLDEILRILLQKIIDTSGMTSRGSRGFTSYVWWTCNSADC